MVTDLADEKAAAPPQPLPVFFNRIEVLDPAKHAHLKLHRGSGFRFAAKANSISLCLQEIVAAADFYPIVFAEAALTPLAVVGCRDGENALVDSNGRWHSGVYIPAYLRAWPFIPIPTATPEKVAMGFEPDSDHLRADEGVPLFDDKGQPGAMLKELAGLALSYRNNLAETREFVQALDDAGLLHKRGATLKFRSGNSVQAGGFKALDPAKCETLSEDAILAFHRRKWLPMLFAILRSSVRWSQLIDLAEMHQRPVRADSVNGGFNVADSVPSGQ